MEAIDSPHDLRRLDRALLPELATELRQRIINTVATTGGHLAPSLGVVELTVALHYIFNTPADKIIWDVGHQCYAHKLLTGRRDSFATLRRYQGISGFPKRQESEYDTFDTGHSSTSISAALGMAVAADLKGEDNKTIAVIGDGSMTGGLAFEGLNQAGHLGNNLIVILNDNEMSISPNVGALSSFLSRKLTGRTMVRIKRELEYLLKNRRAGENILQFLKRSEESLKGFFTPGMLFEALKFEYVGPIPGHKLEVLLETLSNVRDFSQGPVLIHVLTTKGKGYPPAEERPGDFHGVGPFEVATGKIQQSPVGPPSYTKVFGDTLLELATADPRLTAITAAMPGGTGLDPFATQFPDRFFDVGIAEQHALTFAAGLASEGLRPVVAVYSTFLQRAFDQIIHDVCLPNLPVILAVDRGGVVGDDGPTHHGVFDLAFLRIIPNLLLMAPKDENELRHMLYTALHCPGPAALRYPRGAGVGVELDEELHKIPFGTGEILREGDDLLLLPVGNRVYPALEAAAELAADGIEAAVINPRFIKPLDGELICHWAEKTGRVVTVEDNVRAGGFGSAVLELLQRRGLSHLPAKLLGLPDHFLEHGSPEQLRQLAGIDPAAISAAARQLLA
ncbi:MAG: 1-deoxy-D-xylulose-5-phosphate synthase [Desulfurivibrio sp.]|nr:1-deoxy-D-xylulose-5-phosphate synthase [Desulfurivibrio sp.]